IDSEQHSAKMTFNDTGVVICHLLQTVSFLISDGILQHHWPYLIVDIHQCKGTPWQLVKKRFLRLDIIVERLVKIAMIVRYIGEYPTGKIQSRDSMLYNGMRAYFHKTVIATFFDHFGSNRFKARASGVVWVADKVRS